MLGSEGGAEVMAPAIEQQANMAVGCTYLLFRACCTAPRVGSLYGC
jgi:hypothetical protein